MLIFINSDKYNVSSYDKYATILIQSSSQQPNLTLQEDVTYAQFPLSANTTSYEFVFGITNAGDIVRVDAEFFYYNFWKFLSFKIKKMGVHILGRFFFCNFHYDRVGAKIPLILSVR